MMTQLQILELRKNPAGLAEFLSRANSRDAAKILDRLGRLSSDFDRAPLLDLLRSHDPKLRMLAVKNLAKLSDFDLMDVYLSLLKNDVSSSVRREAVSAIGRMRDMRSIPILLDILNDADPEIVLQALRGLLVFKQSNKLVHEALLKLRNHPNEMVQEVIARELATEFRSVSRDATHVEFPQFLGDVVVEADIRDAIKVIPDQSVHLTFTSPPYYNARDYSTYKSYGEYLDFLTEVFTEVHRITKDGRFLVLNTSPIIIPRVSRSHSSKRYPIPYDIHSRLVAMGWEFVDDIVWLKPEASVKNRNAGFLQHRKPLAYKPNSVTEMLMVYRKKTDKLIDWNIKQYSYDVVNSSRVGEDYETTNVWKIDPVFDKTHSAVFPRVLCDRVIKYYSYKGDLVFDPFAGSGTVGVSAILLKRHFLLVEQNSLYVARIRENLINLDNYIMNIKCSVYSLKEFRSVCR